MPHEISVNIEYMFHEAGDRLEDRIALAAKAGFRKVEMFATATRDVSSLRAALDAHGCELLSVCTDPRMQLVIEGNHDAFREAFAAAVRDAVTLGCRYIVVPSGTAVPYMKRPVQLAIVAKALSSVVPVAEAQDVVILLEAANTRMDHPGVLFGMTEDAVAVLEMVDSPRVRLLYDLYHSLIEREDPSQVLPSVARYVDHIQLADLPGRVEPGAGQVDWPAMLQLIESVGYTGTLGVECSPSGPDTVRALQYIRGLLAG